MTMKKKGTYFFKRGSDNFDQEKSAMVILTAFSARDRKDLNEYGIQDK